MGKMHWTVALQRNRGWSFAETAVALEISKGRLSQLRSNRADTLGAARIRRVWRQYGPELRALGYGADDLLSLDLPDEAA